MKQDGTAWIHNATSNGFGTQRAEDDFLHREGNPAEASVSETYYFGFHVPEEAIHGNVYIWVHPNLGVITAGALISRGFRPRSGAADYFNMHAYLAVKDHVDVATGAMRFPGGLQLTPIEPMRHWHVQLDDASANTRFDLQFIAAMPAAVRADQKHFDQNMRVEGSLVLRGREYRVDCHEIRDRSWSNPRPEDRMPVPPYDWLCLTRGDRFAMNLSLFDDLSVLGDGGGVLHAPPKLLQDGWVWRDGQLRRIVEASKRTERSADILRPTRHEVRAVDDEGRVYDLVGEIVGSCNWNGWPNMLWHQCLTRWTCNGEEAWGETQEVQWHDVMRMHQGGGATG
jgi:hypothetical protein